jgi:hypothetical protein
MGKKSGKKRAAEVADASDSEHVQEKRIKGQGQTEDDQYVRLTSVDVHALVLGYAEALIVHTGCAFSSRIVVRQAS